MKITDERLKQIVEWTPGFCEPARMAEEIIQSRALITELRALAERMRNVVKHIDPFRCGYCDGERLATDKWRSELDSLLSAHGAQGEKA